MRRKLPPVARGLNSDAAAGEFGTAGVGYPTRRRWGAGSTARTGLDPESAAAGGRHRHAPTQASTTLPVSGGPRLHEFRHPKLAHLLTHPPPNAESATRLITVSRFELPL